MSTEQRPMCQCGEFMNKVALKAGRDRTEYFRCARCGAEKRLRVRQAQIVAAGKSRPIPAALEDPWD